MKNTKLFGRIVCLILAVVMCLSLAACGSSGQSGTANTKKDQELIIRGGMNLRLFEGLLSSCFSE